MKRCIGYDVCKRSYSLIRRWQHMKNIKKIDIHAHAIAFPEYFPPFNWPDFNYSLKVLSAEQVIDFYDRLNIEKGVLLPICSAEGQHAPITSEETKYLVDKYPDRFLWFCNVDPRVYENRPGSDISYFLNHYKKLGARGVGEVTAQLYADDPLMDNFFEHCAKCDLPVIIHIAYQIGLEYGIVDEPGLPRLEKMLKKHKDLKILGHSQPFWKEFSTVTEDGKVTEGNLFRLLRENENLYCDISAGSGSSAMMKDAALTAKFIEEFSDRILYGCDICCTVNDHPFHLDDFFEKMYEDGILSLENYKKIARENAIRLLKLDE